MTSPNAYGEDAFAEFLSTAVNGGALRHAPEVMRQVCALLRMPPPADDDRCFIDMRHTRSHNGCSIQVLGSRSGQYLIARSQPRLVAWLNAAVTDVLLSPDLQHASAEDNLLYQPHVRVMLFSASSARRTGGTSKFVGYELRIVLRAFDDTQGANAVYITMTGSLPLPSAAADVAAALFAAEELRGDPKVPAARSKYFIPLPTNLLP